MSVTASQQSRQQPAQPAVSLSRPRSHVPSWMVSLQLYRKSLLGPAVHSGVFLRRFPATSGGARRRKNNRSGAAHYSRQTPGHSRNCWPQNIVSPVHAWMKLTGEPLVLNPSPPRILAQPQPIPVPVLIIPQLRVYLWWHRRQHRRRHQTTQEHRRWNGAVETGR